MFQQTQKKKKKKKTITPQTQTLTPAIFFSSLHNNNNKKRKKKKGLCIVVPQPRQTEELYRKHIQGLCSPMFLKLVCVCAWLMAVHLHTPSCTNHLP